MKPAPFDLERIPGELPIAYRLESSTRRWGVTTLWCYPITETDGLVAQLWKLHGDARVSTVRLVDHVRGRDRTWRRP